MRFFLYLLLAAPLIIAQDTSAPASDVVPEPSPTPSTVPSTGTEPSPVEPSAIPPSESPRPRFSGEPCDTDDQCINKICDIYPPTGQRICLNGGGLAEGENCDSSRQCTTGRCDFSDAAPDTRRCIAASSSPTTSSSSSGGSSDISSTGPSSSNGGSSTTPPTPGSSSPTTRPGSNNDNQASVSDIVEVITSVSNGQSVRVTRTRAGASPSGRVVNPSGAANKLSSSGGMILAGLLAALF